MLWALIGILLGVIVGFALNLAVPIEYVKYTAVVIVGVLDSLFGAARAEMTKNQYNSAIFATGLIFNILMALGLTYLGEKLGLDLYLAAAVVFTFRIFANIGVIRRVIIENIQSRKKDKLSS